MYELTITVSSIKEEHVAYISMLAVALSDAFKADGAERPIDISLERDRDGVERIYEFVVFPDSGANAYSRKV